MLLANNYINMSKWKCITDIKEINLFKLKYL